MTGCNSFESLPPSISMESLQILILSACSRLKKFPEIEAGSMEKLARLYLDGTAIKELPSSIQYLTGLNLLNSSDCKNLLALPSSMQCLTSLKSLILSGCSQLHDIPENLSSMEYLEELDVSGTAVRKPTFIAGMKSLKRFSMKGCKDDEPASKPWHSLLNFWGRRGPAPMSLSLPSSFSGFPCLTELDLSDCNLSDGAIPDDLGSLLSLRTLCLSGNNFVSLPECISQLVKLLKLDLRNCSKFESLPKRLPASLVSVDADGCTSLRDFTNQFKIWTSPESMTLVSNLISKSNYQDDSVADIPKRKVIVWSPTSDSSMHHVSVHDQTSKITDDFALPTQALQKSLEQTLKSSHAPAQYVLAENEIPEWFSRKNMNKFVNIQLTGDLKDDKNWMGVAVCAVFSADGTNEFEMEPKASDFFRLAVGTNCFKMKPEDMIVPKEHLEFLKSTAHFLYIVYLPGVQFPDKLNESSFMWAKFKSKIPGIKVEKCGIRLLYEQDSEGFVQTVMQLFDVDRKKPNIPSFTYHITQDDKPGIDPSLHNQFDKIFGWKLEKFQTREENSVLLRQRNIKSVLRRYLERLKHESKTYNFFLCRIPAWFRYQVGSSVKFDLPRDLHKSKRWMGYVMCALLKGNNGEKNRLISTLQMEKSSIMLASAVSETLDSDQLLIMYIPKDILPEKFVQLRTRHSRMVRTTFKIEGPCPAGIEVQMCGFRLLYQEHLEEFIDIITECIVLSSDTMVEENNLVKDWLTLIRVPCDKQDHEVERDNSREVAAAQRGRESEFIDPHKREEFQEISKYIRNRDWSVSQLSYTFPGIQVPNWFYVFRGGPASIPLPLKLYEDDKWLGVAVATHMSLHENPTIIRDTPDSEFYRQIGCLLHTNIDRVRITAALRTTKAMWLHSCDFTWFFYIPRAHFSATLNLCNVFQAKFMSSSTVGLGLHECGLRLVFEEDTEDLVQTLTHCILSKKCDGCEQEKRRANEMAR